MPKKVKYKRQRKYKGNLNEIKGKKNLVHRASCGVDIDTGEYGLRALRSARLTSQELEAARKAIVRKMKRLGKCRLRVFPDIPVTNKAISVRMGKGKGGVAYWAVNVDAGKLLFELEGVSKDIAIQATRAGSAKLPIPINLKIRNA